MVRVPRFDLDAVNHNASDETVAADMDTKASPPKISTRRANALLDSAVRVALLGNRTEYSCDGPDYSKTDHSGNGSSEQPANELPETIEAMKASLTERMRALKERSMASGKDQDTSIKYGRVRCGTGRLVESSPITQDRTATSPPASVKPKTLDLGSGGKAVTRGYVVSSAPPQASSPLDLDREKRKKFNSPRFLNPASVKHDTPHAKLPPTSPPTIAGSQLPDGYTERTREEIMEHQFATLKDQLRDKEAHYQALNWKAYGLHNQLQAKEETIRALQAENVLLRSGNSKENGWDRANLKQALESVTAISKALTDQKSEIISLEKAVDSKMGALRKDIESVKATMTPKTECSAMTSDGPKHVSSRSIDQLSNILEDEKSIALRQQFDKLRNLVLQDYNSLDKELEEDVEKLIDADEELGKKITSIADEQKVQKHETESAIEKMMTDNMTEMKALVDQIANTTHAQAGENRHLKVVTNVTKAELEKVCSRVDVAEKETSDAKAALDDARRRIKSLEQASTAGRPHVEGSLAHSAFAGNHDVPSITPEAIAADRDRIRALYGMPPTASVPTFLPPSVRANVGDSYIPPMSFPAGFGPQDHGNPPNSFAAPGLYTPSPFGGYPAPVIRLPDLASQCKPVNSAVKSEEAVKCPPTFKQSAANAADNETLEEDKAVFAASCKLLDVMRALYGGVDED